MQKTKKIIRKERAGPVPGPNEVCRNYPKLSQRLWKLLKRWYGFYQKEEGSKTLSFALVSSVGKMLLPNLAKPLATFIMTTNNCIDTSV